MAEITELRHTVRASTDMPGYVDVLEGSKPILCFWTWDAKTVVADGDNATKVVFAGPWHERIRVALTEVRSAMADATALWRTESRVDRK